MNSMKYYVDVDGVYLGGWDENPPSGAFEVPLPPDDARQMWADGEWTPVPVALPSLEPWQFFAMLDLSGKRADLDAFIDAMPEPQKTVAKAKLNHSLVFYRDNDLVLAAQGALGLSDAQLDTLWTDAKAL